MRIFRKCLSIIIVALGMNIANSKPLSEDDKLYFIEQELPFCLKKQRNYARQVNIKANETGILVYCKCYLQKISQQASLEQILEVSRTKSTSGIKNIIEAASKECS